MVLLQLCSFSSNVTGETIRLELKASALLSKFQNSLMQQGVCRILVHNPCCLKIVWNSVDPVTGRLKREEFCCTEASFLEGRTMNLKCDCRIFAERLKCMDNGDQGVCPHVLLFDTVRACVLAGNAAKSCSSSSTFDRYLFEQLFCAGSVTCVHSDNSSFKFFVNVTEREASVNRTTQVALCRMQRIASKCYVCCENFRCKRGKMKSVKATTSVDDLCVHLQAIANNEQHGHAMKLCEMEVNDSGE